MRVQIEFDNEDKDFVKQKADAIKETEKFIIVSVGNEDFWFPVHSVSKIRVKN